MTKPWTEEYNLNMLLTGIKYPYFRQTVGDSRIVIENKNETKTVMQQKLQ